MAFMISRSGTKRVLQLPKNAKQAFIYLLRLLDKEGLSVECQVETMSKRVFSWQQPNGPSIIVSIDQTDRICTIVLRANNESFTLTYSLAGQWNLGRFPLFFDPKTQPRAWPWLQILVSKYAILFRETTVVIAETNVEAIVKAFVTNYRSLSHPSPIA